MPEKNTVGYNQTGKKSQNRNISAIWGEDPRWTDWNEYVQYCRYQKHNHGRL